MVDIMKLTRGDTSPNAAFARRDDECDEDEIDEDTGTRYCSSCKQDLSAECFPPEDVRGVSALAQGVSTVETTETEEARMTPRHGDTARDGSCPRRRWTCDSRENLCAHRSTAKTRAWSRADVTYTRPTHTRVQNLLSVAENARALENLRTHVSRDTQRRRQRWEMMTHAFSASPRLQRGAMCANR